MNVPFNRPYLVGNEMQAVNAVLKSDRLCGNGFQSSKSHDLLKRIVGSDQTLLTNSCTAALEMCALLADLQPGDEVIMPSFTFVSTANAVVLRGAVPVFVDIRTDTFNIDERLIESAITERTRAIMVVHYGGVSCEMDEINAIARRRGLLVIEDAAQGMFAYYRGRHLGSLGDMSAFSFHETKNIQSGEGGALCVNNERFNARAEILWEKGTNRSQFLKGVVDKYTWVDVGSSFLPSEITAAFLNVQLQHGEEITRLRLSIWQRYHDAFKDLELEGALRRPMVPGHCTHNAHLYPVLLPDGEKQDRFLALLREKGVNAVFHYVPLHSAPAGKHFGREAGPLSVTVDTFNRLVRLPLWAGMSNGEVGYVCEQVCSVARLLASDGGAR